METSYGKINNKQSADGGMALSLILLLAGYFSANELYYQLAIPALVITMAVPVLFKPFAWFWFNLAALLGRVVSAVLLTLIYVIFVVPVGLIRRLAGKDSLKLKEFRKGRMSVLIKRDHTFTAADIEKPY